MFPARASISLPTFPPGTVGQERETLCSRACLKLAPEVFAEEGWNRERHTPHCVHHPCLNLPPDVSAGEGSTQTRDFVFPRLPQTRSRGFRRGELEPCGTHTALYSPPLPQSHARRFCRGGLDPNARLCDFPRLTQTRSRGFRRGGLEPSATQRTTPHCVHHAYLNLTLGGNHGHSLSTAGTRRNETTSHGRKSPEGQKPRSLSLSPAREHSHAKHHTTRAPNS